MNNIKIIEPQTKEEFEAYFLARYETLRKPWNQPLGSEKDKEDLLAKHFMAVDEMNVPLGVCRLQFNSQTEAQIRFMGVVKDARNKGVGLMLIKHAEHKAIENKTKKIILHARESAITFYQKCGYEIVEKSYLMWNEIQHYLMKKELA